MKNFWKVSSLLTVSFIWALIFPGSSWAHSKLESSVPAADAMVSESVEEVSLSFNENIDENLSILNIKNEQGEEVEAEVTVAGDTLTGVLASPLVSGTYTVDWKIVSADGHPVEGSYNFQVDAPEQETAAEAPDETATEMPQDEQETASSEPSGEGETSDNNEVQQVEEQAASEQENNATGEESGDSSSVLWVVVSVIAAVIIGYFGLKFARSRQRK